MCECFPKIKTLITLGYKCVLVAQINQRMGVYNQLTTRGSHSPVEQQWLYEALGIKTTDV